MNYEEEQAPRKPLKPHQAALRAVGQCFVFFLFATAAIQDLLERRVLVAFLFAVLSLIWFGIVLIYFRIYRQVKNGKEVILRPGASPGNPRIPAFISFAVTCILTAFITAGSAFVLYITKISFNTFSGWTFCGVTLLMVWLFVAHCWYRVLTDKPQVKPVLFQEQPEGVWPPAPLVSLRGEDTKRNG